MGNKSSKSKHKAKNGGNPPQHPPYAQQNPPHGQPRNAQPHGYPVPAYNNYHQPVPHPYAPNHPNPAQPYHHAPHPPPQQYQPLPPPPSAQTGRPDPGVSSPPHYPQTWQPQPQQNGLPSAPPSYELSTATQPFVHQTVPQAHHPPYHQPLSPQPHHVPPSQHQPHQPSYQPQPQRQYQQQQQRQQQHQVTSPPVVSARPTPTPTSTSTSTTTGTFVPASTTHTRPPHLTQGIFTLFRYIAPSHIPDLIKKTSKKNKKKDFHGKSCPEIARECGVLLHFPMRGTDSACVAVRGPIDALETFVSRMDSDFFRPRHMRPWSSRPLRVFGLGVREADFKKLVGKKGATLAELEQIGDCVISVPNHGAKRRGTAHKHMALARRDLVEEDIVTVTTSADAVPRALMVRLQQLVGYAVNATPDVYVLDGRYDRAQLQHSPNNDISEAVFFPDSGQNSGSPSSPDASTVDDMTAYRKFQHYLLSSQRCVDIAIYSLTDDRTKDILLRLAFQGIQVRIFTEKQNMFSQGSDVQELANWGVHLRYIKGNDRHLMHHKFAVIDESLLINGSFNWSVSAAKGNRENVTFTNHPGLVGQYGEEFGRLWAEGADVDDEWKQGVYKGKGGDGHGHGQGHGQGGKHRRQSDDKKNDWHHHHKR